MFLLLYWTCMHGHIPSPTLLFPWLSSSVSLGNGEQMRGQRCHLWRKRPSVARMPGRHYTLPNTKFRGGGEAQLAAITGAFQVNTHLRPRGLMGVVLSDLLALRVPLNHHQDSVNSQILLTQLHHERKKNPLTLLI